MAGSETRKQQIARRLRVSERVLEQYLQLKRAEVEDSSGDVGLTEMGQPLLERGEKPLGPLVGPVAGPVAERGPEPARKPRERRV
jgi:hypothetical protein